MENIFMLIWGIMFIIILGLLGIYIILHIIDKNLAIKEKEHNKMVYNSNLKFIILHLENISEDILNIVPTKLTNKEKLYFVDNLLEGTNMYLGEQIKGLKKIQANATNIK